MNQNAPVLIPAKRFGVWIRLYERFLLEPSPAVGSNAYVAPVIQPITDADRLLLRPDVRIFTVSITTSQTFDMATVPQGQRWKVYFVRMELAGGTWTHNRIDFQDPGGQAIAVDEYAQTGGSELKEFTNPLTIDELWAIRVNVDSHSVTGNGQLTVLIEVEDAF